MKKYSREPEVKTIGKGCEEVLNNSKKNFKNFDHDENNYLTIQKIFGDFDHQHSNSLEMDIGTLIGDVCQLQAKL